MTERKLLHINTHPELHQYVCIMVLLLEKALEDRMRRQRELNNFEEETDIEETDVEGTDIDTETETDIE